MSCVAEELLLRLLLTEAEVVADRPLWLMALPGWEVDGPENIYVALTRGEWHGKSPGRGDHGRGSGAAGLWKGRACLREALLSALPGSRALLGLLSGGQVFKAVDEPLRIDRKPFFVADSQGLVIAQRGCLAACGEVLSCDQMTVGPVVV